MIILHLKRIVILLTAFLFLLIIVSCEEDSPSEPTGDKPTIVSFTANPSTVPAGGDSVKLSWEVNDATSLSISSGVGSVTPADSGSKTIFVSSSTTFTLTATNSAGNVTADAQVNVAQSLTISGYVKDIDGEPIAGATVIIKGKSPTTTGATGNFSVSNVTVPYEIRLIISGFQQSAVVYQGLTRSDPTLFYLTSTTPSKSATISGTVPPAAGKTTLVFFASGTKAWSAIANPTNGTYSIFAEWKGSTSSYTGNLQVLRWTSNPNGLPLQYDAYGSENNVTISNGGSFPNNNFVAGDFTDPAEQSITGSITRPSTSYSIINKNLYINFGNAYIQIAGEPGSGLTDNFSYTVPTITGATFQIDVNAVVPAVPSQRITLYSKKGISGGSTGINITLASAPQLNLPANNGIGIDTTTQFLWTEGSGAGISLVYLLPMGQGPTFYIFTDGNSANIPNLSPQGLGLPFFQPYQWLTVEFYPLSSINAAASESFISFVNGNSGDYGRGQSETFNFTTKTSP
jgi:Carboxypeptidase regulatory-like domain